MGKVKVCFNLLKSYKLIFPSLLSWNKILEALFKPCRYIAVNGIDEALTISGCYARVMIPTKSLVDSILSNKAKVNYCIHYNCLQ
jgi:hypothetical protein